MCEEVTAKEAKGILVLMVGTHPHLIIPGIGDDGVDVEIDLMEGLARADRQTRRAVSAYVGGLCGVEEMSAKAEKAEIAAKKKAEKKAKADKKKAEKAEKEKQAKADKAEKEANEQAEKKAAEAKKKAKADKAKAEKKAKADKAKAEKPVE